MVTVPGRTEAGPQKKTMASLGSFCPGVSQHTWWEEKLKPPPSTDRLQAHVQSLVITNYYSVRSTYYPPSSALSASYTLTHFSLLIVWSEYKARDQHLLPMAMIWGRDEETETQKS